MIMLFMEIVFIKLSILVVLIEDQISVMNNRTPHNYNTVDGSELLLTSWGW